MNTNFFHNILNAVMALCIMATIPEFQAFFPPEMAVTISSVAASGKLLVNVFRDGVTGLVKNQPPVRK